MTSFTEAARLDDLRVGAVRVVRLRGTEIALCRTARGVFALENRCPHRGGPLGEGDIMGDEIICPWHFWTFSVETGCTMDPDGPRVKTFPVRISDGAVLVQLEEPESRQA